MKTNQFTEKAIEKFTVDITDRLFLFIQNDKELMQDYLNLLKGKERDAINSSIAKAVKATFNLENIGESKTPTSTLIKSFKQFKPKQ